MPDRTTSNRPPARRLLLATQNAGKLRELRQLLAELPGGQGCGGGWELVGPGEAEAGGLQVEEDGVSYEENAALKARAFADASGLPALADDSGLEVDALEGAPGIHSARYAGRYAGASATDAANRAQLLAALAGVPAARRGARYRAVVAVARPDQAEIWFAQGTVEGRIAIDERGSGGFGYDPVFELPDGRRMAELSMDEKNAISHRARAVQAAAPLLERLLAELLAGRGA